METLLPGHNLLLLPEVTEQPEHAWSHSVFFEGQQGPISVKGVVGFAQIQEDQKEWFLFYAGQLLGQLGLDDGS